MVVVVVVVDVVVVVVVVVGGVLEGLGEWGVICIRWARRRKIKQNRISQLAKRMIFSEPVYGQRKRIP